jgi:outer membrane protein OmpA-like peptidoglycan-associated protein
MKNLIISLFLVVSGTSCGYRAGPDKQGGGTLQGVATGAVSGGITGAQIATTTGPGIWIGAGLGAVAGAAQGMAADSMEQDQRRLGREIYQEAEISKAHQILAEHYERRLRVHPTRDIYPADYFFNTDERSLNEVSKALVEELARLNKDRLAWSRLRIINYIKSNEIGSSSTVNAYATQLALDRSKAIMNEFVANGVEPRRIEALAMIVDRPLVLDPEDSLGRFNQAVEIIPIDR